MKQDTNRLIAEIRAGQLSEADLALMLETLSPEKVATDFIAEMYPRTQVRWHDHLDRITEGLSLHWVGAGALRTGRFKRTFSRERRCYQNDRCVGTENVEIILVLTPDESHHLFTFMLYESSDSEGETQCEIRWRPWRFCQIKFSAAGMMNWWNWTVEGRSWTNAVLLVLNELTEGLVQEDSGRPESRVSFPEGWHIQPDPLEDWVEALKVTQGPDPRLTPLREIEDDLL